MLACTFVHRKFLAAPNGKVVLRAFLGGVKNEALMEETDETLVMAVRRELTSILGERVIDRDARPEHTQVSRCGEPWRNMRWATRNGSREFRRGSPNSMICGWPEMPTTASVFRLHPSGRQAARNCWQADRKSPSHQLRPFVSLPVSRL